ncbi:hypothetical protein [Enterococcus cecorum]|uniref:hypothetical protein n=1 Tax=Enterococcus cecorum TaxID=44008 RepID=UPI0038B3A80F
MKEGNKQIVKIITSLIFGSLGSSVLSFVIGLEILSKTNSALAFGGTQLIGPVVSLVLLPFAGQWSIVLKRRKSSLLHKL